MAGPCHDDNGYISCGQAAGTKLEGEGEEEEKNPRAVNEQHIYLVSARWLKMTVRDFVRRKKEKTMCPNRLSNPKTTTMSIIIRWRPKKKLKGRKLSN